MRKYEYDLVHIPRVLYTLRIIIILIVAIVIPFTILMTFTYQVHFSFIILFSFGIAFLLFKISSRYVRNHLHVIIKGDLLSIVETSTITQKKIEKEINWNNLKSYFFETTQFYHVLRLYTIKGEKIILTFDQNSQQYSRFEKDFHNKVSLINRDDRFDIYLNPSIYETKTGFVISIVLLLLMIGWPLVSWLYNRDFKIGLAVLFYSSSSFFIYMVYQHYRQKKHLK